MIRNVARNATLVAMAALLTGAVTIGCSGKHKDNKDDVGSIGLALRLANGADIAVVTYKISGNGITPLTGGIAVTDPAATTSVLVNGIPAGAGYLVEMSATSTDGKTTCGGSNTFDVVANQTSMVTVAMQCRTAGTTGSVIANGTFNQCPVLTGFSASPLAIAVGGKIAIGSAATDSDAGSTLTYAWTATAGTFDAAGTASTSYNCSVPGAQTLTIKVSDGDVKCDTTATIPVTCVALACGNGAVDLGEQCDPPSAANHCDANCQIIPVCGNNVREGSEQCDPPNNVTGGTYTCDSSCNGIPIVCGNSFTQPGEQCDPPNGTTCSATCQTVVVVTPVCGDGTVNGTDQCEPPGTATCSATCQTIDACGPCETAASTNPATLGDFPVCDPAAWGCSGFSGAQLTACTDLLGCLRTNHCFKGDPDYSASACYCGTASDLGCITGAANGICKAKYEAAAGTSDPGTIGGLFVDPSSPVGRVNNQITCDSLVCKTQCQF